MTLRVGLLSFWASLALVAGCTSKQIDTEPPRCVGDLEVGDPNGHTDPFGAKAAGQARAGRLADVSGLPQPATGRQGFVDGDFVLVNDKMAVFVEDAGISDGYARFGGEILAVDAVGDDGMPLGVSKYGETLMGIGLSMPDPSLGEVSVLADGSDGGPAVVRARGRIRPIPFLAESIGALFNSDRDLEVAYDYVLEPGAEKLLVRVSVVNPDPTPIDLGAQKAATDEFYGFFHSSQMQLVSPESGFADPGLVSFAGFVAGPWGFGWRSTEAPLEFGLADGGFSLFAGPGFMVDGCAITTVDRVELVAGGPEYDGLREAVRRADDEEPWRPITGTVTDAAGAPVADAFVHVLDDDGAYLTRTTTAADGSYLVHAPPGHEVELVAQKRGYEHPGTTVPADQDAVSVAFDPHATLHVLATRAGDGVALPVRVQVIPTVPVPATPPEWGVEDEANGRLYQDFAVTGEATLVVPPGEHRVIVSRGYEYELHDETVTVAAGDTAELAAPLAHSVDTTDWMCADFHIHSFRSADSADPIDFKVKGAIADGLDIPCSSEHEWVVDFGPIVKELGLEAWAFGMASEELTTFKWGHFGVVPMEPRPGELNNGAVDWIGKSPAEVFDAVDALDTKPALIVNHPSGSAGIGAYFTAAKLDPETGEGKDHSLWSENFDAIEVFNDSDFDQNLDASVDDWFALLNAGKRFIAVGNSDSHHLRTSPAGYPRTCFPFGHDDPTQLTPSAVRDAILAGTGVVSGGLFMTVDGPAGAGPGATIAAGDATFAITVEGPTWIFADSLEAWVRGEKAATEMLPAPTGPTSNRYVVAVDLSLAPGDWVVFHVRGSGDLAPLHPGRRPFAVSNPIFVE
jgi:carboxypeptidase family protein